MNFPVQGQLCAISIHSVVCKIPSARKVIRVQKILLVMVGGQTNIQKNLDWFILNF